MKRLFFAALLVFVAFPGASQSTSNEIRVMLEERDASIKALLGPEGDVSEGQRQELQHLINGVINFREMGKQALGPFWKDLTPEQRDGFVRVFSEIVRHQSLSDLDVYRASVTYDAIAVDGDSARVTTTTIYDEIPVTVEYDLLRTGGEWTARDIILDDVSTVGGYSRSFQTVIRKRGFDSLMNSLNKRLDSIRSES